MATDLEEAKAILEIIRDSEGERDALATLKTAGYSDEDAEALLDAGLELLFIANGFE